MSAVTEWPGLSQAKSDGAHSAIARTSSTFVFIWGRSSNRRKVPKTAAGFKRLVYRKSGSPAEVAITAAFGFKRHCTLRPHDFANSDAVRRVHSEFAGRGDNHACGRGIGRAAQR